MHKKKTQRWAAIIILLALLIGKAFLNGGEGLRRPSTSVQNTASAIGKTDGRLYASLPNKTRTPKNEKA